MSIYYHDQLCLNCLCGSIENAKEILEVMEGHALIGLLSTAYENEAAAVSAMLTYQNALNGHISVGLGGGNPAQWQKVAHIAKELKPAHVNQLFTAVGYTRALCPKAHINALVSPSGTCGLVKVSVGPLSQQAEPALIPISTAIEMIREMGGNSLKFFPMQGLTRRDELMAVAEAAAKADLILEPTGGITTDNLEEILRMLLNAGVKKIIPHVYTSIMDEHGVTRISEVKKIAEIFKKLL